jgi:hypothetical protein
MSNLEEISAELADSESKVCKLNAWVGFDGTVDNIVDAVDSRQGLGENYIALPLISDFAQRIGDASGLSTNIELFLKRQKVGGNAAIMAGALANARAKVELVATLGRHGRIHPVFNSLKSRAKLRSLGEPSQTHAVEFADGKIMLGYTQNLEAISFANLQRVLGGRLRSGVEHADIVALLNWTMVPAMTDILKLFISNLLPKVKKSAERIFFFDLADPQKRHTEDLAEVLELLKGFSDWGEVILGLNLKEARQCARVMGVHEPADQRNALEASVAALREKLNIARVVIHATDAAVCANQKAVFYQEGPRVEQVRLRTGAGDHFNAGFAIGAAIGASAQACLALGVAFSGFYVGEGRSPSYEEILEMIAKGW